MELILDILVSPSETFRRLKREPKTLFSSALILLGWTNLFLGLLLFFKIQISIAGFFSVLLAVFFLTFLSMIFKTMWIHFVSELMGGEGKITTLFSLFGFGNLPLHLFLPVAQLGQLVSPLFTVIAWLFLLSWSGHLHYKAVHENYQLSNAKTVLVLYSPAIFFLISFVVIMILFSAILTKLFFSLGSVSTLF